MSFRRRSAPGGLDVRLCQDGQRSLRTADGSCFWGRNRDLGSATGGTARGRRTPMIPLGPRTRPRYGSGSGFSGRG